MRKREDGYVLVLVLVTMAALAVLSLAAMQVNLATNKLTVIRTEDTQLNEDAKSALRLIADEVRTQFPLHGDMELPDHMESEAAFNSKVQSLIVSDEPFTALTTDSEVRYSIELKRDSTDTEVQTAPFTTILQVNVTASRQVNPEQPELSVEYTQDLYLTALPSFLYYVLGSDEQLNVNGMPTVKGNMYSNGPLTFNRDANYQLGSERLTIENLNSSRFHLDGRIDLSNQGSCTSCQQENYFTAGDEEAGEKADVGVSPSSFSPFQYDYSIIEFLNRSLDPKLAYTRNIESKIFEDGLIASTDDVFELERILSEDGASIIDRPTPYLNADAYNRLSEPTILKRPDLILDRPMYVTESITESNAPLLFDGDVVIESIDELTIARPLIVRGNLTIRGNVSFNSTVYTLGDTFIDRANILPIDEEKGNSLILLSKGKILLNRINEFDNTPTTLQAFMYSDSEEVTKVYAVGSILEINGGLYSKGPLEVNVFRGKFAVAEGLSPKEYFDNANYSPAQGAADSRLKLTYNDAVFNQLETLPITNQLQFFVSHPVQIK
ncbi:hypothetical protein PJK55_06085 [Exiguobacterium sp. MMG028]|uniref:hypothetical protein n=1 Tax=Exiguobacterium sp. MMG028 TaxID=3021979 RepID=UPI0022FDEB6A|nr:hypothetical protein [Exiguobacterium sp. MMG028]MDA5560300.1 hypothetical protein [Exiguobacterium sp. MMG028]